MKRLSLILGCVLLFAGIAQAADKPVIRLGARVFTEQTLLAEITAQYLRSKGYDAQITGGLGSNLARSAHETGQLDMLWEYTGVSLVAYNHVTEKLDSAQSYARVKELDAKKGLVWLTPSKFSNTYALALPKTVAEEYPQIHTISQLNEVLRAEAKTNHLVALDTEFANRSDGLDGMVKLYDMNLTRKNIRQMDAGLVYTALRNGQVFAGLVYTTDGRLNAFGLKLWKTTSITSRTTPPHRSCVRPTSTRTRNWRSNSSRWPSCSTTKPCASSTRGSMSITRARRKSLPTSCASIH